jgi:tRNA(Ile)-lysidine synthetase-like protein
MRPARLRGKSKKLSDLFIDAKVPRAQRASARVCVRASDGEIVWAEHLGVADGESPDIAPKPA